MIIRKDKTVTVAKSTSLTVERGIRANVVLDGSGTYRMKVARRGVLHVVNVVEGSGTTERQVLIELVGVGALAKLTAAYRGSGSALHSFDVSVHHVARETKGDILIRGVFGDRSRGTISGIIKVGTRAKQSSSYLASNVLLVDSGSAVTMPTLEIEADDVRASHGSTTERIDRDQLFYLTSRGVSERRARSMITDGFLEPARNRLPNV